MISLAELAALHAAHSDALAAPVRTVEFGGASVGDDAPAIMGCVNLSRDSSYRESVAVSTADAIRMGRVQALNGACVVDLGAESSYVGTRRVGPSEQIAQLVPVVEGLAGHVAVSVETYHPEVVSACLRAGASLLNMTGREHEETMLALAAEHDAAVVMCFGEVANVREVSDFDVDSDPWERLLDHFGARVERARELGVERLILDPGIGFHYGNQVDPATRARHQSKMLAQSFRLRPLGLPVCNALPHAFDLFTEEFRTAEGFFAFLSQLGGTHLFRVHEVFRVRAVLDAMSHLSVR